MALRLPLATLLSHALVAHTIEWDHLYEARVPHFTTVGKYAPINGGGPWLISQPNWTLFLRHVPDKGIRAGDLQALACLKLNTVKSRLHHLEWWKHIEFSPSSKGASPKTRYVDLLVKPTGGGKRSRDAGKPLGALVDKRWRARHGAKTIDDLTGALRSIVGGIDQDLPDSLPIVDYLDGMRATLEFPTEPPKRISVAKLDLSALLSRALLTLTLDFEDRRDLSLTISQNVLRVVEDGGTSLKELAARGGIAKEGVGAAVNFLKKHKLVTLGTDEAKMVRLTAKGKETRAQTPTLLAAIEKDWTTAHGAATVTRLRGALEALDVPNAKGVSALAEGMEAPRESWRWDKRYRALTEAFLTDPRAHLPHHPMILHRGGFPDGS